MISKEKIIEISQKNSQCSIAPNKQSEMPENLEWAQEKQSLCKDIANLPDNELLDLLALMDYGRELSQKKAIPNHSDYNKSRQQIVANIPQLNEEIKRNKAIYLLEKRDLSSWLCATLPLFDIEQFEF